MSKLIYVMDPHCGWCYGNSGNITDLYSEFSDQIDFELMVGGMWVGYNAPNGGSAFERFINNHSPQMEATTGAYVSKVFYELVKDSSYVFSSLEPAAAIVLIKDLAPEHTFAFAKALQRSIFAEGKRLDKIETYQPILRELKIEPEEFEKNWMSESNISKTQKEINSAKQMASGFPTLLFHDESGTHPLASGYFNKEEMVHTISNLLRQKSVSSS